jgi:hypothetical protein
MADNDRRSPRTALLLGSGRRARETGAVLSTLSTLDAEGESKLEALPLFGVADLEELLAQRPLEGLLILDAGRVPGEDIGFVRRFLERHPGWRLVVVGENKADSRALLALARARWLPWPPDLEELRALLAPLPDGEREPGAPAPRTPASEERGPPRRSARKASPPNGGVELGGLLEELLAGAALQGDAIPRFQFRAGEPLLVHHERAALIEGLGGLVELARLCAGGDGLVRAALDPSGDAVLLGLEFPRAGLPEKDLPSLLERAPTGVGAELAEGLAAARRGAELLRELGGRVELAAGEPGRLRCEVRLNAQPIAQPAAPARSARTGKPEDPFA